MTKTAHCLKTHVISEELRMSRSYARPCPSCTLTWLCNRLPSDASVGLNERTLCVADRSHADPDGIIY